MSKPKKSKSFNYQLEDVLKVREIKAQQQQEKLSRAIQKVVEEKAKEDHLKALESESYDTLLSMMKDALPDMNTIKMRKYHLEALKKKVIDQVAVRKTAEDEEDEARKKLVQAMLDKKIIEKDKEKTHKKWQRLMNKENSKFLDEIAVTRFDSDISE
jgi:flagellar export protein FliJ